MRMDRPFTPLKINIGPDNRGRPRCSNFCVAGGGALTTSTPAGAPGGRGRARLLPLPRSTEPFLQPLVERNPFQVPRKA